MSAIFGQAVKNIDLYNTWFIEPVYPVLDYLQFAILAGGMILLAVGLALYTDFWQEKKEELYLREQKLSIVNNVQRDAHQPYQLMDLLSLTIKEIVAQIPESCGAVYMVNRSRRQLILAETAGLTKNEIALFEKYPLAQNIITQAIELNEPIVSGYFEFIDADGKKSESRFQSTMILPMVSSTEKIGCICLFSEAKQCFSSTEINYLMPLAEWLSEKIKSTKLKKNLNIALNQSEDLKKRYEDINYRLLKLAQSFSSKENIDSFCRSLVGFLNCQSAHIYGITNGMLNFYGGSEPLLDLSENFKTALIDALDKNKPLIINQEAQNNSGNSFIARATFIHPMSEDYSNYALMLVNDGPFDKIDDDILKIIAVYGELAKLTLKQNSINQLDITRKKGFENVLSLLNIDRKITLENNPDFFVRHLSGVIPSRSIALSFEKNLNGSFKAIKGFHTYSADLEGFEILPGEALLGGMNSDMTTKFIYGRNKVESAINQFSDNNRNLFYELFDEEGVPVFMAACPLGDYENLSGVALFFMFDISEQEKNEWVRLITLAGSLYTLRMTINKQQTDKPGMQFHTTRSQNVGEIINKLNNHLNAIIGNAELAELSDSITGEMKNHFQSIINEADYAAEFLKKSLPSLIEETKVKKNEDSGIIFINDLINESLDKSFISENMFMIGGRPREVNKELGNIGNINFENESLKNLFEEAINRFASLTDDEDIITVATYHKNNYVYLDISRHHKNFPSVEQVSDFGEYQLPKDILAFRPVDAFLNNILDENCFYSYDRHTTNPSYLSFKFPAGKTKTKPDPKHIPHILAIDDQDVILDLIKAMAQTSGFKIDCANSPEKGLQMAFDNKYDVILTDLSMPGLSGLELAKQVRKARPDIPIVLLTGWEVNLDKSQLESAGITKVLYKPFRIEQMTEIIKSITSESENII